LTLATFDPFKTPFKANSSGVDKMFDLVKIRPSATGDMVITDKNTGIAKSITKAENLSAVQAKKLPPPDAELKKLDFSKVKTLVEGMNSAWKTSGKSNLNLYFDTGFKMDGLNTADFIAQITQGKETPEKIDGFVFGPCNVSAKVCEGTVALINKDGSFKQVSMPVKFDDELKTWKWFGNQREVGFYFGQHLMIDNSYNSTTEQFADPEVRIGFVLDAMNSNKDYSSIELVTGLVNADKSITWEQSAIATWAANLRDCPSLVNQFSTATKAVCSSFVDFSQMNIDPSDPLNAKFKDYNDGKLRFKLKFTKTDSSVSNVEFRPSIENIPKTDAGAYKSIINNAFVAGVTQGFGTSKDFVMPKGVNVENLTVFLADSTTKSNTVSNLVIDSMGIGFKVFGDSISVEELCNIHKDMVKPNSSNCSANNIISAIYWTFKTPLSVDTKVTFGFKRAP